MDPNRVLNEMCKERPDLPQYIMSFMPGLISYVDNILATCTEREVELLTIRYRKTFEAMCSAHGAPGHDVTHHGQILFYVYAFQLGLADMRAAAKAEEARKTQELLNLIDKREDEKLEKLLKQIEDEHQAALRDKDKIIEQYKIAFDVFMKALSIEKDANELQELSQRYLLLSQQNAYFITLLKNMKNPLDPILMRACIFSDINDVKAALKFGADVNARDTQLDTPLHKACAANNMEIVKFLLTCGANASSKNTFGKAPAELASNSEISNLLASYRKSPAPTPSLLAHDSRLFSNHVYKNVRVKQHEPSGNRFRVF